MKFFRSIRWKLQLWYGVLLITLLGGFGFTAYRLESTRQSRRIDEELQQRIPILVASQKPVPGDRETRAFRLSPKNVQLFDRDGDRSFYYVVWLKHGDPVTRSTSAPPDVPQPMAGDTPNRTRGDFRESFLFPGPGDCVLVGRSILGDLAGLRQFAYWLTGSGAAILALGLAVGGWLVTRALRPIQDISSTAEKIANGNLTERIHSGENGSELGQLATVLNATFDRLDAAFSRQAEFTANAAHELRTPLSVMLTHTQNGLESEYLTEEQREAFEASQRAVQRMRRLTESLLTLARLDAGAESNHGDCDPASVARETTQALQPLAEKHQVKLETDFQSTRCRGNASQLGQILTNLIDNAILHNHAGGKVRASVSADASHAILVVSDTGPGIPPDHLPHVFERFHRVDQARSGAPYRTGLGLAITQALVEMLGGTIAVESRPGNGTTFTVRIPLMPEPMANR